MSASIRPLAFGFLVTALVATTTTSFQAQAQSHGRSGGYRAAPVGGWHAGGRGWAPGHHHVRRAHRPSLAVGVGVGLGLGLGLGFGTHAYSYGYPAHVYPGHAYRYGYYPGAVLAVPAPVVHVAPAPVETAAPMPPDPVIYPNHQQSAAQTEFDRRECNRWALTQPQAIADAGVFHRATMACMEGRGYTVR